MRVPYSFGELETDPNVENYPCTIIEVPGTQNGFSFRVFRSYVVRNNKDQTAPSLKALV